jgi:hypothetical protein
LCLRNALFDALEDKERADLEFEAVWTTSFQDPIFNDTWHREWIDHLLYTDSPDGPWVADAKVHHHMPDGTPIWEKYEHASDHYPLSVTVTV